MLERDFHQLLERLFDTPRAEYQCLTQEYCLSEYACEELLKYACDIARGAEADTECDWRIEFCSNVLRLVDYWLDSHESDTVEEFYAISERVACFHLGGKAIPDGGNHG